VERGGRSSIGRVAPIASLQSNGAHCTETSDVAHGKRGVAVAVTPRCDPDGGIISSPQRYRAQLYHCCCRYSSKTLRSCCLGYAGFFAALVVGARPTPHAASGARPRRVRYRTGAGPPRYADRARRPRERQQGASARRRADPVAREDPVQFCRILEPLRTISPLAFTVTLTPVRSTSPDRFIENFAEPVVSVMDSPASMTCAPPTVIV